MSKIIFAVVLVFGVGGYFAGRVIGAEPALPSVSAPVTVGASDDPSPDSTRNPSSDRTPEGPDDDDVDVVRPRPSDIGDDYGDDGPNHDLGDDHGGDRDDDGDDNSGPGSSNSGSDDNGDDNSGSGSSGSGSSGSGDGDDD